MKTIVMTAAVALILGLSSCKKEYTCECSKTRTTGGVTVTVEDGKYQFNDTRTRAESRCNDQEEAGSDGLGDYTRDCEIK